MQRIRTVFYALEGAKTYIAGMLRHENFKSESDAISYLIALGMRAHNQERAKRLAEGKNGTLAD